MDTLEPTPQQAPAPEQVAPTEMSGGFDVIGMKIAGYFDLGSQTNDEKQIIQDLKRIFNADQRDIVDVLWEIKNIENRIGTPPVGTSRIKHVHNFAKLNSQIKSLEQERNLYGQ